MSRALTAAVGLMSLLTACVDTGHQPPHNKTINTALTGVCLATQLAPCTIATSADAKASAKEAKAASIRAGAQQDANAASRYAAQRSSCLTDVGPTLPMKPGQCQAYGQSD